MLDNIALFISLCEIRSFKNCAEKLGMQPSTLSKHISELESKLGKLLIIRTSKRFELTEFGNYLYNKCKHIPLFIESTIDIYERRVSTEKKYGTLNIALGSMISYKKICLKLYKFIQQYPDIKLNISFIPNITTWLSPQMDVILAAEYIKGDNLDNRFVSHEYTKLYCSNNYAVTYGTPNNIEDLANHSMIGIVNNNYTPLEYVTFTHLKTNEEYVLDMRENQLNINYALHMRQIGLTADFIFGSYESLVRDDLIKGLVQPVLPEWGTVEFSFYLVTKKQISDEIQLFVNFIYECMKS